MPAHWIFCWFRDSRKAIAARFLRGRSGRRHLHLVELGRHERRRDVDQQLARAETENKKLVELKTAVQADTWVEKFARTVLHYARPDETLVLPRSSAPAAAITAPTIVPTPIPSGSDSASAPPQTKSFWIDLLDWLFGPPE